MSRFAFDPKSLELGAPTELDTDKEFELHAMKVANQIIEERRHAGEKNPEMVPVVLRKNPTDVRRLNFSPSNFAARQALAETLVDGRWRLATSVDLEADEANRSVNATKEARRNFDSNGKAMAYTNGSRWLENARLNGPSELSGR